MKGLGDLIAFVTKVTGIKALVKFFKKDCGCEKRQEKMNVKYPF